MFAVRLKKCEVEPMRKTSTCALGDPDGLGVAIDEGAGEGKGLAEGLAGVLGLGVL